MTDLLFKDETYQIRGCCFEVYKEMGCGFLERVYHECLVIEMRQRGIPFVDRPKIEIKYKGERLNVEYVPDFLCFDKIIVELKTVTTLNDEHRAQVHNYLKATGIRLGLLVNFGHYPQIEIERIVR